MVNAVLGIHMSRWLAHDVILHSFVRGFHFFADTEVYWEGIAILVSMPYVVVTLDLVRCIRGVSVGHCTLAGGSKRVGYLRAG